MILADLLRVTNKSGTKAAGKLENTIKSAQTTAKNIHAPSTIRNDRKKELQKKFNRKGSAAKSGYHNWSRGAGHTAPRRVSPGAQVTKFNKKYGLETEVSPKERYKAEQSQDRRRKRRASEAEKKARKKAIKNERYQAKKSRAAGGSNKGSDTAGGSNKKGKKIKTIDDVLKNTEAAETRVKGILGAADTLYGSFVKGSSEEGAFKRAAIGTLQAGATGAVVQGGLAALNGDDPWEAAKSGAIKGAMLGVGYQTMKTATRVNEGGVWKNTKAMAKATRDTYRTQTVKGRELLQQDNGKNVSKYVSKIIEANQGARVTDDFMHTVSRKA